MSRDLSFCCTNGLVFSGWLANFLGTLYRYWYSAVAVHMVCSSGYFNVFTRFLSAAFVFIPQFHPRVMYPNT